MSKLLNQSQQAQQAGDNRAVGNDLVDGLLGIVRESSKVSAAVTDSRLEGCKKLVLKRSHSALISEVDEFNWQAAESFRAMRTRLMGMQLKAGFRSVVVTSATQGDGKTLTCMNLALCSAQLAGCRVLLVDADLRTHGLTKLLGHPGGPGLSDILSGKSDYEQAIWATNFPNLYVLGGGAYCSSPPELLAGPRFKDLIGWAGETFKLVLVDAPPFLTVADCELVISGCDAVMVVVRALHTHREVLESIVSQLDPKRVLGFVYNGAENTRSYGLHRESKYNVPLQEPNSR